jgi:hypothetical protein
MRDFKNFSGTKEWGGYYLQMSYKTGLNTRSPHAYE